MTSGEAWILILGWWEPYFRSARASPGWLTLFLAHEISVFESKSWWGLRVTPGRTTGGCPWIWLNRALDVHSETGTPGTLTSLTRASKSKTRQRWYFLMWMIPRLTWPKQPVPSHQGGIEPRWIFQTVNPKHGTMILLQPLQCFGQTCSLWWATRSQWTSVTRVWNTSNHTGIIRYFYSNYWTLRIYIYIFIYLYTFIYIYIYMYI